MRYKRAADSPLQALLRTDVFAEARPGLNVGSAKRTRAAITGPAYAEYPQLVLVQTGEIDVAGIAEPLLDGALVLWLPGDLLQWTGDAFVLEAEGPALADMLEVANIAWD